MMKRIMETGSIGYAYEYPDDGSPRREYMLTITPKNLANFIAAKGDEAERMVITDPLDRLVVDTVGGFLNNCPDQKLCRKIIGYLAPIQMGEKEAGEVLAVERDVAEEYFDLEDETVAMTEGMTL